MRLGSDRPKRRDKARFENCSTRAKSGNRRPRSRPGGPGAAHAMRTLARKLIAAQPSYRPYNEEVPARTSAVVEFV